MTVEIVAVGSELLLGQIIDTNSTWIAEHLARIGVDCLFQTRVGDNIDRISKVLDVALSRSDAVIVCGGLGPTQDDITREAIAQVTGKKLRRDPEMLLNVERIFAERNRVMVASNARQADIPDGATFIVQRLGTAPGLICPIGEKVIYAVPGVPDEMKDMLDRAILPDLVARSDDAAVIASRTIRTWGLGESNLAEIVAPRLEALDARGPGAPTIAFLASGIEGIKVRVTVKAKDERSARALLDAEEIEIRALLRDAVFGIDEQTMEYAIGDLLMARNWTLAVAESFTGGLIETRIVALPGASRWFVGGVVAYQSSVKHEVLKVPKGPVVSIETAVAMAKGVRELLRADVGIATTGVAGPEPQEGVSPGTGFVGIALPSVAAFGEAFQFNGNRNRVREIGTISALDSLRRHLLARDR